MALNFWQPTQMSLDITISRLRPVRGSSQIPLPKKCLEQTKALINMQNHDQQCFKWAVTRALNPVDKNPQRITKGLRKQVKNLTGMVSSLQHRAERKFSRSLRKTTCHC